MTILGFKKYLPLLELLTRKHISRKCFTSIINSLDDKSIKFICECIHNTISLKYISALNKNQKSLLLKKILPNKRIIKHLCKRLKHIARVKNNCSTRVWVFIIPILSAIVPLISSLLGKR